MTFTITTCLNKQDYIKVMFIGLYKKPYYIVATIFGLCLLTVSALNYFSVTNIDIYSPLTDGILGLFLVLSPSIIVLLSLSQIKSNPSFLTDMSYTFTEDGMSVIGATFKSEFIWEHIIKQKEISNFLILYHTKKFGNFIDKSKLTNEQLQFIKSNIGTK